MASTTISKSAALQQRYNTDVKDRRRASIKSREAERIAAQELKRLSQEEYQKLTSSKYPKRDILYLKKIFDTYDVDASGSIDSFELMQALQEQKETMLRYDGRRKTLEERQAERGFARGQWHHKKGAFLVDFSDSIFLAMDANTDGRVDFEELLRVLYPYATEAELRTMLFWVAKPESNSEELTMSDTQLQDARTLFQIYDKDRSGTISLKEFKLAVSKCGLHEDETLELFTRADADGNKEISFDEFLIFMKDTFLLSDNDFI